MSVGEEKEEVSKLKKPEFRVGQNEWNKQSDGSAILYFYIFSSPLFYMSTFCFVPQYDPEEAAQAICSIFQLMVPNQTVTFTNNKLHSSLMAFQKVSQPAVYSNEACIAINQTPAIEAGCLIPTSQMLFSISH